MRAQLQQIRRPITAARRSAYLNAASIHPILKLVAFLIFLPAELSFYLFDFRLTLIRFVLFVLTPVLFARFIQLLISGKTRLLLPDLFVTLTGVWMIVAPAIVFDFSYSLHHSAPFVGEICGSYLATRVLLSRHGQALSFITLLCYIIAIVALSGVPDAVAGRPVIHDFAHALTGYSVEFAAEFRLGIYRAMGPIDHPILFGIVCGVGLLLAITLQIRAKALTIAACGLGVFLSLSSAPIAGAMLGLGLLTYDRIMARFQQRWLLLIAAVGCVIGASYASNVSPLNAFSRMMLDPQTYWVRLLEWQFAGGTVLNSPWVGIGFEWGETAKKIGFMFWSIDSLWLYLATTYGIPGAVLVALSIISAMLYPSSGRAVNLTAEESKLATGLNVSLAVVVLLGFTVHFWAAAWMLVGLLVGVRAHLADLGSRRPAKIKNTNLGSTGLPLRFSLMRS